MTIVMFASVTIYLTLYSKIWHHIVLSFTYAKKRPPIPIVEKVQWKTVQAYTFVQFCCAAAIFGVAQFAGGLGWIFPALVGALVPVRSFFVSRVFNKDDLVYLDPISQTEEETHDEKVKYLERRPSVDEAEIDEPGFSDFHAQGIKHDIAVSMSQSISYDVGDEVEVSAG